MNCLRGKKSANEPKISTAPLTTVAATSTTTTVWEQQQETTSSGSLDNVKLNITTPYSSPNGGPLDDSENFLFGSARIESTSSTTGADVFNGTRVYFLGSAAPQQGAFRAGITTDTAWDLPNVGIASVAFGKDNLATKKFSAVGGGQENQATNNHANVGGGYQNVASGNRAVVAGGYNNIASEFASAVLGGQTNKATGNRSVVVGGSGNMATGDRAIVGGGTSNIADEDYAAVLGGNNNTAQGLCSIVAGGQNNVTIGPSSSPPGNAQWAGILGGQENSVNGRWGTIGGGFRNTVEADYGTVAGGRWNKVLGPYSGVLSGTVNRAGGQTSAILGGSENEIATSIPYPVASSDTIICGGNTNQLIDGYRSGVFTGLTNRMRNTGNSAIMCGTLNEIKPTVDTVCWNSFVGGGVLNKILGGNQSAILCGGSNTVNANSSSVLAGENVTVEDSQTNTAATQRFRTTGGVQHQGVNSYATSINLASDPLTALDHHVIVYTGSSVATLDLPLPSVAKLGQEYYIKATNPSGSLTIRSGVSGAGTDDFYGPGATAVSNSVSVSAGETVHIMLTSTTDGDGGYVVF